MGLGHGRATQRPLCESPGLPAPPVVLLARLCGPSHPPFSVLAPNIWKKVKHLLPRHRMSSGFQMEDALPPDAGGTSRVPARRATPPECCPLRRLSDRKSDGAHRWRWGHLQILPSGSSPSLTPRTVPGVWDRGGRGIDSEVSIKGSRHLKITGTPPSYPPHRSLQTLGKEWGSMCLQDVPALSMCLDGPQATSASLPPSPAVASQASLFAGCRGLGPPGWA